MIQDSRKIAFFVFVFVQYSCLTHYNLRGKTNVQEVNFTKCFMFYGNDHSLISDDKSQAVFPTEVILEFKCISSSILSLFVLTPEKHGKTLSMYSVYNSYIQNWWEVNERDLNSQNNKSQSCLCSY